MKVARRTVLAGMAGGLALGVLPGRGLVAHASGVEFEIVVDGQPKAAITVSSSRVALGAARLLQDVVQRATGVEVPVIWSEVPSSWKMTPIYLDKVGNLTTPGFDREGLAPDAYRIDLQENAITILGGEDYGSMIGVIDLTETLAGAQYLLPGDAGTKVATSDAIVATSEDVPTSVATPDFTNRRIYAYGTMANATSSNPKSLFGSRLRLMQRSAFTHNMGAIFDPAKYAETHPEYYPVINGERRIPASATNAGWNPRFQDDATVAPAVEYALAELTAEDSTGWVAMGINDNGGYSDDTVALATIDPLGLVSLSNVYCRWLNKVAAGVEAALGHQDFRLGFLAYNDLRSAPDFKLHPSAVPYITRDLYGWVSPELEAHDRQLLQGWSEAGVELGWWDYPWGSPLTLPRLFHHTQQRAFRALHAAGVRHVFAEMDENVGDGCKPVIYAKLLWDVDIDVDAEVERWCRGVAGDNGAVHLKAFDDHWNTWWATKALDTEYLRSGIGSSYLWRFDSSYLNKVSDDDANIARDHLTAAAAATTTADEQQRMSIMTRSYEYFRASALSYDRDVATPATALEAKNLFLQAIGGLDEQVALAQRRIDLVQEFKADPVLAHRVDGPTSGLRWHGWPFKVLWEVAQFIIREGRLSAAASVYAHVRDTAQEHPSAEVRAFAQTLQKVADGNTINRAVNGDLASGELDPWIVDRSTTSVGESAKVVTGVRRNGPGSIRVVGAAGGGVRQAFDTPGGYLRASFWVQSTPTDNPVGIVTPTWLVWNAAGARTVYRGEALSLASCQGVWRESVMSQLLPDDTVRAECYLSYLHLAVQSEFFATDISFLQTM